MRIYSASMWQHESLDAVPVAVAAANGSPSMGSPQKESADSIGRLGRQQRGGPALRRQSAVAPMKEAGSRRPGGMARYSTRAFSSGRSGPIFDEGEAAAMAKKAQVKVERKAGELKSAAERGEAKVEAKVNELGYKGAQAAEELKERAGSFAATAAEKVEGAAEKAGAMAGKVAAEAQKPAAEIAADAGRAAANGAQRAAAALGEAARVAESDQGAFTDIEGVTLREELEVTSEYPMETGVTPPSYLTGATRDREGRDMVDELPADLEEGSSYFPESGMTRPSSLSVNVPLYGPGLDGTVLRGDVKEGGPKV
jgi:hypothetical protein